MEEMKTSPLPVFYLPTPMQNHLLDRTYIVAKTQIQWSLRNVAFVFLACALQEGTAEGRGNGYFE